MIELFEQDMKMDDRQSSKGNLLKWKNCGIWYKADYTGYEGLAEYIISHLLQKSTLSEQEYVLYDPEQIKYKSKIYSGVKSKDFLQCGWQIITLERLFQNFFGRSLYQSIFKIRDHEERLIFLVNQVERITGLTGFGKYLNKLLTIDAFFLNEDRHTHNIAVLMDMEGKYHYCPIFDNGAALLSDTTMDYPLNVPFHILVENSNAKTFCTSFDEQLDTVERLYGQHIRFHFDEKEIDAICAKDLYYSDEKKERVKSVLLSQRRKYQYLFR